MIGQAKRHRALQLWYSGESYISVCDTVGIDHTTLYKIVREHEATTLKPALSPEMRARLNEIDRRLGFK